MSKATIILVAPQMGENIGAAARAMKNFGLNDLRIVSPRDGWPNERAKSMAVGAIDLVLKAKIYDNLKEAIADLAYVYATTAVPRDMNKEYLISKELLKDYPKGLNVGIMFGRENCGLKNEEITLANKIITINTTDFSSLNIAQAIAIICYELFDREKSDDFLNKQELASKEELSFFLNHLESELDKKNFFKVLEKKPHMMKNIVNIFTRINNLSKTEVQTLRGIIRSLAGDL